MKEILSYCKEKNYVGIQSLIAKSGIYSLDLSRPSHSYFNNANVIQAIANGLERNLKITRLYLEDCNLTDKVAHALGELVTKKTGLTFLSLNTNRLSDGKAIANGLTQNATLEVLRLRFNLFSPDSHQYLAQSLHSKSALKELYLDYNTHGSSDVFLKFLSPHNSLTRLDLIDNKSCLEAKYLGGQPQRQERTEFISLMILLACGYSQPNNCWSMLPGDVLKLIFSFYNNDKRFLACGEFIFEKIETVKTYLKHSHIHIKEKLNEPISSKNRFNFFPTLDSSKLQSSSDYSSPSSCPIL